MNLGLLETKLESEVDVEGFGVCAGLSNERLPPGVPIPFSPPSGNLCTLRAGSAAESRVTLGSVGGFPLLSFE